MYDGTSLECDWPGLSDKQADDIEGFLDSLDLTTHAAMLLPEGRETIDPLYARLQDPQSRTLEQGGIWSIGGVAFRTDDLGRTLAS